MKVKDWINFLKNDNGTDAIGLQLEGGMRCRECDYIPKDKIADSILEAYGDKEVIIAYYPNYKRCPLLIYKK